MRKLFSMSSSKAGLSLRLLTILQWRQRSSLSPGERAGVRGSVNSKQSRCPGLARVLPFYDKASTRAYLLRILSLSTAIALLAGCGKKDTDEITLKSEAPSSPQNTVWLTAEQQQTAGLKVEAPQPAKITPEIKGFGRVVDPAALAGMIGDFTTAQAANNASQA